MQGLEAKLEELLVKKAPFHLPENARKGLVEFLPWITLVAGVLMIMVAWGAYQALTYVARVSEALGLYAYGVAPQVTAYSPLLWFSLLLLVVEAVLFFAAFPALKDRKKLGWNILFWVSLVNIVNGIVQFVGVGDLGQLLGLLLGSVIGLYLLFQVRSYYTGAAPVAATAKTGVPVPPATTSEQPQAPTTPPASEAPVEAPKTPDEKI